MADEEKEPDAEGAEGAPAEGEGGAQAKKKLFGIPIPSTKILIIGLGGLVALGGIGGGSYWFFVARPKAAAAQAAAPVVKPPVFVDLPEVLVNLSTPNSERSQYLKVKVVLELPEQTMISQIQPIMPRVMDAFQTYLRELRPTDLDGSAGLYRLREELTRRVNVAVAPSRINAVLFKEIVVQ
jgi:flagellar FliL protein